MALPESNDGTVSSSSSPSSVEDVELANEANRSPHSGSLLSRRGVPMSESSPAPDRRKRPVPMSSSHASSSPSIRRREQPQPHNHHHQQQQLHQQQYNLHNRHHRRRTLYCCPVRAALIALLFLWITLQLSLARIHIWASIVVDGNNHTLYHRDDEDVVVGGGGKIAISSIESMLREVDGGGGGGGKEEDGFMHSLLGPSHDDTGRRRTEYDYILVFYVLMMANVTTMLPAWFRRLFGGPTSMIAMRRLGLRRRRWGDDRDDDEDEDGANDRTSSSTGTNTRTTKTMTATTMEYERGIVHDRLLRTYLPAYLLATCADWLQGPYKYALYSGYGYGKRDIAHLFVAGYGSGMVLGGIIGGLADTHGRRRLCLVYCASYAMSVLTKHCRNFRVLLVGRAFGGIATSLLFSVFESWFICAHGARGLGRQIVAMPPSGCGEGGTGCSNDGGKAVLPRGGGGLTKAEEEMWLARGLSASSYGSSLVAIGSGVIANRVVAMSGRIRPMFGGGSDVSNSSSISPPSAGGGGPLVSDGPSVYVGGYISAFDACLVPLSLCATMILLLWEENYGESSTTISPRESKDEGVSSSLHDGEIATARRRWEGDSKYAKKHPSMISEDVRVSVIDGVNANDERQERVTLLTAMDVDKEDLSPTKRKRRGNTSAVMVSTLLDGVHTVWNSPDILICCIVGSVFEGAMYIFIFLWTPTLTSLQEKLDHLRGGDDLAVETNPDVEDVTVDPHGGESDLPFGWIFSTFMGSCMLGTIAFSRLSNAGVSASKCLAGILGLASLSCLMMARPVSSVTRGPTSSACTLQYFGMLLYEFCIGF
jgi:hypothetical protein